MINQTFGIFSTFWYGKEHYLKWNIVVNKTKLLNGFIILDNSGLNLVTIGI